MKQKFKLSFEGIEATLNSVKAKIKSFGNTVNSTFSGMKTSNLNNQLKNTEQYSKQSINSIMRSLKELRTELNKAGQYNQSNAVKEFSKNFMREQGQFMIDDRKKTINKSLQKIGDTEVSSKWVRSFEKAINTAEKKASLISKMGNNIVTGLNKALTLTAIAYGMRKLGQGVGYVAQEYISLVESNNLFQVSMKAVRDEYGNIDMVSSTYYKRAIDFQNQMSEKLGANKKELQNYQAIYMNMFSGQGISNDISYRLSESLTKAGYDLASLYNKDIATTMENLQSGISGQPEGLRKNFGIDISEGTLNGILDDLGIERSIDQLSYAEKEVARYIAILRQAGNAQGDFAKTIDSPANQLKMLKNQFAELAQVAGSFVVNWFGGLIAYVNGAIMAVKQVLIYFATLFGYDLDFGGATSSMQDTSDAIGGIGSGLSDASGKAKELKKELMGFDEINNIQKPSDSSGGGGGGASGAGIDSKLLEALDEWDNKMEGIQGKAQKLRDDMLEWLGFERDDDGTWKLKEAYNNLEKIKDVVIAIGVAFGTWTVSKAITNLLSNLGILSKPDAFKLTFGITLALTGIFAQYKGTEHLLDGDVDLFSILETLLGTAGGTYGIVNILNATKFGKGLSLKNKITIGAGIMILLQSIQVMVDGIVNNDIKSQMFGALESGLAGGLLLFSSKGLKFSLKAGLLISIAMLEIQIAIDIVKWWNEYFEENKKLIYGDKKELNLGEMIYVGLSSVGEGVNKNIIEPLFGKDALKPVIDWTADVIRAFNKLGKDIEKWWTEKVAPWFTKEKWQELGENIKTSLTNKWTEFKDWWGNTAIVQWWDNNVAPWFTKKKWEETADNAKTGIENKFTEWKNKFKPIEDWWNEKITPWFTKEKWQQVANNAKTGIETKFNEWKNNFNPVSDWWNSKIKPWFTKEKWQQIGKDAMQGIQTAFSGFNFKIKLPHFTWSSTPATGWIAKTLSALNLPTSIPKLNVSWYANGGMPDMGEMFIARESGPELVGKIGNRTAVANNDQIVTAIKQGVYEAVMSAMASGSNEVHLDIRADEGIIVKKATEGIRDFVNQTGELPFPIPI